MPVLCAIFLGLVHSPDLEPFLGSYRADCSKARKHRDALEAAYGNRSLVLARGGTFEYCGSNQGGYWRKERDKLILVYSSFFGTPFNATEETLKRSTPRTPIHGLVLHIQADKTLRLDFDGIAKGPVLFKKKAEESLSSLIRKNGNLDHPDWPETFMILKNRATIEQKAIVDIALDPKASNLDRTGAGFAIGQIETLNGETFQRLLDALPTLRLNSGTPNQRFQQRALRNGIVDAFLKHPTRQARRVLIAQVESGTVQASQIEPLFDRWKQPEDEAVLSRWLNSKDPGQIQLALKILAKQNSDFALESAHRLISNDSIRVKYYAHATIARLSPNRDERVRALAYLKGLTTGDQSNDAWSACRALGIVQTAESLPYLAATLLAPGTDALGRSSVVEALGELQDPRAVQSLLEAFDDDSLPSYPMFKSNILEALEKIGKAKVKNAGQINQ